VELMNSPFFKVLSGVGYTYLAYMILIHTQGIGLLSIIAAMILFLDGLVAFAGAFQK